MLSKTYDALIEAGVSKEKAEAAAEELAGYEHEFAEIKSNLRVLQWSQAATFAMTIVIFVKLLIH